MSRRFSRPKVPVFHRVSPPSRRTALQLRLVNDIPHYAGSTLEHTHHALELVERKVDAGEIPNILDSDERVVGYLFGRAETLYGAAGRPPWWGEGYEAGYALYQEAG